MIKGTSCNINIVWFANSNNMLFLSIVISIILLIILALASLSDIQTRRIPNYLPVVLLITSLAVYVYASGVHGLLFSLKGMGIGFVILFVPYIFGGMGAGDVKLMAGVGAAVGPGQVLLALLFTSIFGGILAIVIILAGKTFKETLKNFYASAWLTLSGAGEIPLKAGLKHKKKTKVPYGVVIACGTLASMLWQVMVQGKLPVGNL
ncbi:A24 family peptidase [Desulfosediminicola sp.]|uniref:A24 family peptidase n=1 Tax=Desulfosediminicola sp. TaxID=2886825 RepID=UPI003AF24536